MRLSSSPTKAFTFSPRQGSGAYYHHEHRAGLAIMVRAAGAAGRMVAWREKIVRQSHPRNPDRPRARSGTAVAGGGAGFVSGHRAALGFSNDHRDRARACAALE